MRLAPDGDEWLWVATTDSSLHKWPARERAITKTLQRASSFVAGSLPFARARANIDGSAPVCGALKSFGLQEFFITLRFSKGIVYVLITLLRGLTCETMSQFQVPLYTQPTAVIPGTAGIVQHAILNDRRHVLTKVGFAFHSMILLCRNSRLTTKIWKLQIAGFL